MSNVALIAVMLDCGDKLLFYRPYTPKSGAELWCSRCKEMRTVLPPLFEWVLRCNKCRYSLRSGASKAVVDFAAKRHERATGHSDIGIERIERKISLRGAI